MQADLIYAIPLRHPLDEMPKKWPEGVVDRVLSYGGGNNDAAAYLGIKLKTLAEGYEVSHVAWSELASLPTPQEKEAIQAFDQWWAQQAADLRREGLAMDPRLFVVFDPD